MDKIIRRFDVDFPPLSVACSLAMPSGDSALQGYNAVSGAWEPDRSLIPLVVQPVVTIAGTNANAQIAEMHWYRVVGGVRTEIVCAGDTHSGGSHAATSGFVVDTSDSATKGKLTITANTPVDVSWSLEFWAKLLDPRTSQQAYEVREAATIRCVPSVSTDAYDLVLSAPASNVYNPLRDADKQRVSASLMASGQSVPGATYLWEVSEGSGWRTLGTDNLDYWAAANGSYCIVDRKLMGWEARLRCTAQKSGVPVVDNVTRKVLCFVRRIPKVRFSIGECPLSIMPSQKTIAPKIVAMDAKGIVDNIGEHYAVKWFVAANNAAGNPSFPATPTGYGVSPSLPTTSASAVYGGAIGVEADDLGPLLAWADSDGSILTDGDGSILLIK